MQTAARLAAILKQDLQRYPQQLQNVLFLYYLHASAVSHVFCSSLAGGTAKIGSVSWTFRSKTETSCPGASCSSGTHCSPALPSYRSSGGGDEYTVGYG